MISLKGKYLATPGKRLLPAFALPLLFLLVEVFGYFFLGRESRWPLAFGLCWATVFTGLLLALPRRASRLLFSLLYFPAVSYTVVQTGYYQLFGEMLWLSDFRYASEGSDYFSILLSYPLLWWLSIPALLGLGILTAARYPDTSARWPGKLLSLAAALLGLLLAFSLPQKVFAADDGIRYSGSDYGRAQSAEAAYENMFNTHRLYQVCGVYQTAGKDIYANFLYPNTPGYLREQQAAREEIDGYFASRETGGANTMTGLLKDKNVIIVLMESMDDWMIGEHTPTLSRLISESMEFTQFYTPAFGGIRTFNTEFSLNTGSFLSSRSGYAFDYVTNDFSQSLPNLAKAQGYQPLTFHYNTPEFYSRGVFSPALGYDRYVSYQEYETDKQALYDDHLLFDDPDLSSLFFRPGKRLNFVITRSAHLSYKYNEVLSHWGLKKYPQYRGLTGNEETDCALLKARLVDDFFTRLMEELRQRGELENTVIVGITDHYAYGYKDTQELMALSGVDHKLLLEKTPCFIWSPSLPPQKVAKTLNTADLLPTLLNLLGIESPYPYLGRDAFDESYEGFVPFSDGSWICGSQGYSASGKQTLSLAASQGSDYKFHQKMAETVQEFIRINNLILETDYYAQD